jgi:uridine kinase
MPETNLLTDLPSFSKTLFAIMKQICPAVDEMEEYEFDYALHNLVPENGWDALKLEPPADIERRIHSYEFYLSIQTKPRIGDRITLDENIVHLTRMLFAGLVKEQYSIEWVKASFYFDARGFIFFCRTLYFTEAALTHFSGKPYQRFEPKQKRFERFQGVGYKDFMAANAEIDQALIEGVKKIIRVKGTPILLTLAGPTAAGKTEIAARLLIAFEQIGKKITTIEMDNFLIDREFRGNKPMGKATTHFDLFKGELSELLQGRKAAIPQYDTIDATSSHDLDGKLKAGRTALEVDPADIIFIEGNFPFQMKEISDLIGLKIVYLTDDAVRLKRKWKRDIDYRKKYITNFFLNRFFGTQFLRAADCYRSQMENCDMVVDTTGAALWVTPQIAEILDQE